MKLHDKRFESGEEAWGRKRLDASLPSLRSRFRVSVIPCGFHGRRNGVWVRFLGFLPFSLAINFITPFLHTHLIHLVSFHFIHPCDGASGVVGRHPRYSKTFKYRGFIASHPSTRHRVGHNLTFMKSGKGWWEEIEKSGKHRENPKNPDISHHNCPPDYIETRTRNPSRDQTIGLIAHTPARLQNPIAINSGSCNYKQEDPLESYSLVSATVSLFI